MVLSIPNVWDELIPWTVYVYRCRRINQASSRPFELLYDVPPQMPLEEGVSFQSHSPDSLLEAEALAISDIRVRRNLLLLGSS